MAATFQLTFPEACWSNTIVTTRSSQALCHEKSFTCCPATRYTKLNIW